LTALAVFVPLSVPPPGLFPKAMVTLAVDDVFVLPKASSTATWTPPVEPLIGLLTTVFVGSAVNASFAGGPAFTT
jgi:hypothetical protein